jgi:hypothetical protein
MGPDSFLLVMNYSVWQAATGAGAAIEPKLTD